MSVEPAATYLATARALTDIVRLIGPDDWVRPALGTWDVRALVGHTTRALTTVVEYLALAEPAAVDVPTAQEYFAAFAATPDKNAADESVAARGVTAGKELGADPVAAVDRLVAATGAALAAAGDRRTIATRQGAVPLPEYLRTRTFELVVHGQDLLRALGSPAELLPADAVADAVVVAARTAMLTGNGAAVLAALTGRAPLPTGFSIL